MARGNFTLKIYKGSNNTISTELSSIGFERDELIDLLKTQIDKIAAASWTTDNCCVVCGEIVPEGRQVCPKCEQI